MPKLKFTHGCPRWKVGRGNISTHTRLHDTYLNSNKHYIIPVRGVLIIPLQCIWKGELGWLINRTRGISSLNAVCNRASESETWAWEESLLWIAWASRSPERGGASHIDSLQIQKDAHTRAHICTQGCLAWTPFEAGPNINYLFFSRGLVTVIRVRFCFIFFIFFWERCTHNTSLMRKTGLAVELSRHAWSVWRVKCGCDGRSSGLAVGKA